MRPSIVRTLTLWTSRTLRHVERGHLRTLADLGLARRLRLDVDDDVRLGERPPDRILDGVCGGVPLRDSRAGRDADDDVDEVPPGRLAEPQAVKPNPRHVHANRPARRLRRVGRSAIHEHVDVAADEPAGRRHHEDGDEQRGDGVTLRPAERGRRQPAEDGERPGEVAAEVERVREQRRARVAPGSAQRDDRPRQVDGDDGDHDGERPPRRVRPPSRSDRSSRSTANSATPSDTSTSTAASASAARCSAFPCPYGWPRSAGRPATPTAKNVSSAATRSVPECTASDTRPRLPLATPVVSLSPMSAQAAPTETSAVLLCGVTSRSLESHHLLSSGRGDLPVLRAREPGRPVLQRLRGPRSTRRRRRPREERKVVTVLFCDLVGFTARAESMDPEDVRALLSAYHERVRRELERFGGTVEKFVGDAVMALFGAPVAHEDDPERAVRAALAIRDGSREASCEVRIGITTGEALVALGARPDTGEGMAAGDVVNTAAGSRPQRRERDPRRRGDLPRDRASDRLRRGGADRGEGQGGAGPGLEGAGGTLAFRRRRASSRATPLVGRERELAIFATRSRASARSSEPQLVTLVGVPGIGKSRLVASSSARSTRTPS